jgi:putative transposase
VYNEALKRQIALYEAGQKYVNHFDMCKWLVGWKQEYPWLKDSPSHTLQKALKDLDSAYKNFFAGRGKFPRKKRKGVRDGFQEFDANCFKVDAVNGRIKLPKMDWMRYRNSREILGNAKNITISQTSGKWFASIQTEREVEQPIPASTSAIGIDMGIANFAALSDGSFVAPLNSFKKHEHRLKKYQRRMSRKIKLSKNWRKAKAKVQQVHTDIANARKDFVHKTTADISKNHAMVAVEDLQVRNMSKSAKGNAEKAGKNVAAKSGLNKSILDQGWFEFRRQLEYKLNWNGGMLVVVPAQYTSQTCPCCGHVCKENRQTQAKFACVGCGYTNNADVVGAINVLARGHRVLACGEEGSGSGRKTKTQPASKKQEPTEATICSSNAGNSAVGIPLL